MGQNTGRPHVRGNTQIGLRSGLPTYIGGSIGTYRSADTTPTHPKLIAKNIGGLPLNLSYSWIFRFEIRNDFSCVCMKKAAIANQFISCHTQSNSIPRCTAIHCPFICNENKMIALNFYCDLHCCIYPDANWGNGRARSRLDLCLEGSFKLHFLACELGKAG